MIPIVFNHSTRLLCRHTSGDDVMFVSRFDNKLVSLWLGDGVGYVNEESEQFFDVYTHIIVVGLFDE